MMADPVYEVPDMMMASDDDAADTLVMRPATLREDLERYMRSSRLPLSLRANAAISLTAMASILIAIVAINS